jgi:uncharacterized protein YndB with AHSA1/START domain
MSAGKPVFVVVSRRYDFSAEKVFEAFLDPEKAGKFMFATPTGTMVRAETDPRVGGHFNFTDRRDGEDVEHSGEYLELERPTRIVFSMQVPKYSKDVARVKIDIRPAGTKCELKLTQEVDPKYAEMKSKLEEGWSGILEGLAKVLRAHLDKK